MFNEANLQTLGIMLFGYVLFRLVEFYLTQALKSKITKEQEKNG